MRSAHTLTFFICLLVSAAVSVATTMAMVTMAGGAPAPHSLAPVHSTERDARLANVLEGVERRLANLERTQESAPAPVVNRDADLAGILDRLQEIEQRQVAAEKDRAGRTEHRDAVGGQADAPGAAVPSNLDAAIDRRITWLEEEKARLAMEEYQRQAIKNLASTRETYDKVYDKALEAMNTELGMSVAQVDSMRRLLAWRGDELLKVRDPRVAVEDRPTRDKTTAEFDNRLADLLSPQQLQTYNEKKLGDFSAIQRELNGGSAVVGEMLSFRIIATTEDGP